MPVNRKPNTAPQKKTKLSLYEQHLADEAYEKIHGRIVKDPELRKEGLRLVMDVFHGRMTQLEFEKHWKKLCEMHGSVTRNGNDN